MLVYDTVEIDSPGLDPGSGSGSHVWHGNELHMYITFSLSPSPSLFTSTSLGFLPFLLFSCSLALIAFGLSAKLELSEES